MVELIVVLVIVAVVAAFLVPALLGFIDKGKESEYKAHAQAALSATQTALSDIYNDGGNSFTPKKRDNTRMLAGASESTAFTVWTDDVLWDGRTVAKEENIGSYTIIKAIYKENDSVYMYYDGTNWTKYDTERDAKKAAVGLSGEDDPDTLGNNVIFVWPYKRDFAYLNEKETDPDPENSPDGPEIKVVNFHTDESLLTQAYFKRVGKTGSSVKDSVRVVFWKNGDEINSDYWDGNVFTENENYQYTFVTSTSLNFGGWIPNSLDNAEGPFNTKDAVISYIYDNVATKDITEFDFYADLAVNGKVPEVTLGKSEFRSFVDSVGSVSGVEKVELSDDEVMEIVDIAESHGAVRVDDGSRRIAYIYAWMEGSTVKWCTNALVAYMPEDCSGFFNYGSGDGHISDLNFDGFDASNVTNTSSMFAGCSGLESVVLGSRFASAGITDVSSMFKGCSSLTSVDVENIGTGTLTSVTEMFSGCTSLDIEINFSDTFDTSAITDFENMFLNCGASGINAGQLDTTSAVSLENMFKGCSSLTSLDLSGWNLSNVTTMEGTFEGCSSLNSITAAGLSLGSCSTLKDTFSGCSSLSAVDIGGMGLSGSLTNMNSTFMGCADLSSITFPEDFDTTSITDMGNMFNGCSSIVELDLKMFDTKNVTNFTGMFNEMTSLTTINASVKFVVSSEDIIMFEGDTALFGGKTHYSDSLANKDSSKYAWIDMRDGKPGYFNGMFFKATLDIVKFKALINSKTEAVVKVSYSEKPDSATDVSNPDLSPMGALIYAWREGTTVKWCTNAQIAYMATDCKRVFLNNMNLYGFSFEGFDTSKVKYLQEAFSGCKNLRSLTFGDGENFASVENMQKVFYHCENLETLDLSSWNVGNVLDFQFAFDYCTRLKTLNFGGWYNDKLLNIHNMFSRCYVLKNVDFSQLHFSNVSDVGSMFKQSFTSQSISVDLSNIRTDNCEDFQQVFYNSTYVTDVDITGWRVSNGKTNYSFFCGCSRLKTIYIDEAFTYHPNANRNTMFSGCNALVGGAGTKYSDSGNGDQAVYARIDDPEHGSPGYFTYKAPTP